MNINRIDGESGLDILFGNDGNDTFGQAYTVESDFTPEQFEAVFPGWTDAMKNAPQDFEDLSAPVALEPSLEPPLERTARSRFFLNLLCS